MIKAMSEGRMALPEDKETRAAVQAEIERYRRRQAADDANAAVPTAPQIGEVTIGDMQTKIQTPPPPAAPLRGTPESRAALLESLPGVGKVKAKKIMEEIGIADNRRVQGLGQQQKAALLEQLGK